MGAGTETSGWGQVSLTCPYGRALSEGFQGSDRTLTRRLF